MLLSAEHELSIRQNQQ